MKVNLSISPYLIRAIYDWCCDSGQTPYLSVRVSDSSNVPAEHVRDGEIVLNIGTGASRDLRIDNEAVTFSARFSSVSREIYVATKDIKGIFSRESGQGLAFNVEDIPEGKVDKPDKNKQSDPVPIASKQRLKLVK